MTEEQKARLDALRAKKAEGSLSGEEASELETLEAEMPKEQPAADEGTETPASGEEAAS